MPDNADDMNAPITRRYFEERLTAFGAELRAELRAELLADMQSMLRALNEENRAWFRALDDKYQDLPDRVRKLEEAVFPPPPRTRRRKAG